MYLKIKRVINLIILILFSSLYSIIIIFIIKNFAVLLIVILSGLSFLIISYIYSIIIKVINKTLYKITIEKTFNKLLLELIDKTKVSFLLNDFIVLIKEQIEEKMDSAVIFYNFKNHYNIYNSPNRISSEFRNIKTIIEKYSNFNNGIYLFDEKFNITKDPNLYRGISFIYSPYIFILFNRYIKIFDLNLFKNFYDEFISFLNRVETIEKMFSISATTKEWELLANIQNSFLLNKIPQFNNIEIKTYYQPLVNVSGDFYDIIKIDDNKLLLTVGDVSGKGLSASLLTGIALNTIRITENKENLEELVKNIDFAIKSMNFEDKYITIF